MVASFARNGQEGLIASNKTTKIRIIQWKHNDFVLYTKNNTILLLHRLNKNSFQYISIANRMQEITIT